jgi:hypothetical protein
MAGFGSSTTDDGRQAPGWTAGGPAPALRKTAVFLAAGAALLVAGWIAQPRFPQAKIEPRADRALFPELADASKAASLEVVSYDDELATLKPFKVVQSGGVWVLPAHENYPADAKDQLAAAATELVDLPILGVVSTSPGDHETYGVIEPDPEKIKPGMTGVGQLVEIRDGSGNRLARLVIGKEDKRAAGMLSAGSRGMRDDKPLRFVRRAGQDPVYRVELDMAKFTTKFDDWIEKDLLKLSPWDVRRLVIDDSTASFSVDESSGRPFVSQDRKTRIELAYDDKDSKWQLVKLEAFKANKPEEQQLAADEEVASAKLNDLRNALADLKIVDVTRKPAGLSGDLKAEEKFTGDQAAVLSLAQRGFYAVGSGDIVSSNGDTVVGMKDGVEYVLRFGNGTTVAAADKPEADDAAAGETAAGDTTGRYLFVMARFNEALLEKPALDPLPDVPEGGEEAAAKAGAKNGQNDAKEAEEEKADAKEPSDAASTALDKADEAEAKAQAALEERRRVERENRRKQEEYDAQVKAAQKRVRELNSRFADWYYIVSDTEYAKIHLDRAGVIQKQSPPDAAE